MFSQDFKEFIELLNKNKKIDDLEINFIGYNELIKNKIASGRDKDLIDLKNLK